MNEEKVDEIMSKIVPIWTDRHGIENLDKRKVEHVRMVLSSSPHNDGYMRVQSMADPKTTHLVPFEIIILEGLKGEDLDKYPVERN